MDHGKVIAFGTPRELIATLGAEHVVEFALIEAVPDGLMDALRGLIGVTAARSGASGLSLTVTELHRTLPALLSELQRRSLELSSLTTHHATLDDVFVALTGRQLRDT
jgi:ABC-2 type transport system ATP-binding protein